MADVLHMAFSVYFINRKYFKFEYNVIQICVAAHDLDHDCTRSNIDKQNASETIRSNYTEVYLVKNFSNIFDAHWTLFK